MRNRWTRSTYWKRGKIKISPRGASPCDETLFSSYPLPSPRAGPPLPLSAPFAASPSVLPTRHVANQIGPRCNASVADKFFLLAFRSINVEF